MESCEVGMLAKSKCGHDAGNIYVIIDVDETYVYLADGRIRTMDKLKKKKKKHIQLIKEKYDIADATDVSIKRLLKKWNKEEI